MGSVATITHDHFPKQGSWLGKRVNVCFHYDTAHQLCGTIVRDDSGQPFQTIIYLDSGQYVLASECQYQPLI